MVKAETGGVWAEWWRPGVTGGMRVEEEESDVLGSIGGEQLLVFVMILVIESVVGLIRSKWYFNM